MPMQRHQIPMGIAELAKWLAVLILSGCASIPTNGIEAELSALLEDSWQEDVDDRAEDVYSKLQDLGPCTAARVMNAHKAAFNAAALSSNPSVWLVYMVDLVPPEEQLCYVPFLEACARIEEPFSWNSGPTPKVAAIMKLKDLGFKALLPEEQSPGVLYWNAEAKQCLLQVEKAR